MSPETALAWAEQHLYEARPKKYLRGFSRLKTTKKRDWLFLSSR